MLPPRGQATEPLAGADPAPVGRRNRHPKEGFLDSLGIDPRVVGVVFSVLIGLGLFAYRQYEKRQRYDRVEPGMHISEAAKLLDTGRGTHHPKMVRFRDRFAPDDASTGSYTMSENGTELVLHWENGFVTAVDRGGDGSGGGMRRRATVVAATPGDDEDGDEE
jgi:hypothetical protein